MALEITKTLFNDHMVLKCRKFYKDGIKKSKEKSLTGGWWSYFLDYSKKLIDETKSWNTFIEKLNFPENSFLSCLIYFVEHNLNGAKRAEKLNPVIVYAKFVFSKKYRDAEYSEESIKKLKAEIPKHIKNLNTIKSNMEWYIKTHNKDENSKPQCEFFNSIVPLITNTVAFLEELNKLI